VKFKTTTTTSRAERALRITHVFVDPPFALAKQNPQALTEILAVAGQKLSSACTLMLRLEKGSSYGLPSPWKEQKRRIYGRQEILIASHKGDES